MRGIPVFRIFVSASTFLFLFHSYSISFIQLNKTGDSGPSLSSLVIKYHDTNAVRLAISNTGQIGNDLISGHGAGFWPSSTSNNYIYGTGLWIAGIADVDGDGEDDQLFVQGYEPSSRGTEFREGRYGQSPDDPLASVFRSTDSEDFQSWPYEFWGVDTDPESQTYDQLVPLIMSDQDLVTTYTTVDAVPVFATPSPPLEVRQRSLVFNYGSCHNVVYVIFDIENITHKIEGGEPYTIEEAWVGYDLDVDIGDEFGDDVTSLFRWQMISEGDSIPLNMAFAWDSDFNESNFLGSPGLYGIAFIQSPGNDHDGIDNDLDGLTDESQHNGIDDDGDGVIDDMPDEVDQLGLVNYSAHASFMSIRNDPQSDPEGYRMMSCDPSDECVDITEPYDVRYMISSGPLELRAGETQRIVFAFVFANAVGNPSSINRYGNPPRPDPNDPIFGEFLQTRMVAQGAYDLGFIEAGSPSRPKLTLIPGDGQVTVLWDDSPVYIEDDAYTDFVKYDPSYRSLDFQGFKLWGSRTGKFSTAGDPDDPLNPLATQENKMSPDLDLDLLGQWDLIDGITTLSHGIHVTDSVVYGNGQVLVIAADTFNLGEDTGLRFSYIDRGENGPSLINGMPYYYCVESYDYNSVLFPTSAVSLGSGISFTDVNRAFPRSNASGYVGAYSTMTHVDSDGNLLSDETPQIFIYEEPPGATDALIASNVTILSEEMIHDTYCDFVTGSITPNNTDTTALVRFHVQDPQGSGLYIGGDLQSVMTLAYDSTITSRLTTVFSPSDSTIPLFEMDMNFFADIGAHIPTSVTDLTAVDAVGLDITGKLGTVQILSSSFKPMCFRGTDITITWHVIGADTLTVSIYDTGNRVEIPFAGDSGLEGLNWIFEWIGGQPGGKYLLGSIEAFRIYVSGTTITVANMDRPPTEGDVWTLRQRSYYVTEEGDTIPASRPLVPGTRYRVNLTGDGIDPGMVDLSQIRVVPNPYTGYSEFEFGPGEKKIQFINLPSECKIRIYTIAGVLVRVLDHTPSEAGTEDYDLKTREGLKLASGNYYYHVTTPDGQTRLGRFAIIQ